MHILIVWIEYETIVNGQTVLIFDMQVKIIMFNGANQLQLNMHST